MAINQFVPARTPIDAISKALDVAHTYYGVKQAASASDYLQQKMGQEAIVNQRTNSEADQANDPTSNISKAAQSDFSNSIDYGVKRGIIQKPQGDQLHSLIFPSQGSEDDDTGETIPGKKGLSASQIKTYMDSSPTFKLIQGQQMADAAGARASMMGVRNDVNISKDYESAMKPYRGLQEDISRVESSLNTRDKNGNPLITPQQLADANMAISRIFSPNHQSDATVSSTEYQSLPAMFAKAAQKITADPTDIGSRDLINHIIDQAHHIGNVSNQNALKELDSLDSGYSGLPDPGAQKLAAQKSQFFRQRFAKAYNTIGGEQSPSGGGIPGMNSAQASGGSSNDPAAAARAEIARRQALKAGQ